MRKSWAALAVVGLIVTATSASAQAGGAAADNDGDPWAVGYAVQVARACPEWRIEPQETLAARGVLPRPRPGLPLLELGGVVEREYYRGQTDADADRRGRPGFCRDVRAIAGARWPRLARVFSPREQRP